ncbi:MAG: hypothetical protein NTX07_05405 [Solirubrobacterales bacterium]|nr:hypothetical protein [Solirubrobacterales bacterium]
MLYQVSRSIYRSVAGDILPDRYGDMDGTNHLRVLKACEENLERLMHDREYFAKPAKTLFCEIRAYFPLGSQRKVWETVEGHMNVATQYVSQLPKTGYDLNGNPIQCRATTRRGTSCQRVPLAHNGYCPSHQHLAATEHHLATAA